MHAHDGLCRIATAMECPDQGEHFPNPYFEPIKCDYPAVRQNKKAHAIPCKSVELYCQTLAKKLLDTTRKLRSGPV